MADLTMPARRPPLYRRLAVKPSVALLVLLDVITLGFVTLGFEMVASRILTPLFGSDIYTWATIISICVGGLMCGYFLGGLIADRHASFGIAAGIKLATAAYFVFVWWLSDTGLEQMISGITDDTTALFVSGFVVCFPPLVVLGMYSPLSVRLLINDPADAGTVSGSLFAISSFGNIAGTIITTFQLIPNFGSRAITGGFAIFLIVSGLISIAASLVTPIHRR